MGTIASLVVKINGDISGLKQSLDSAGQSVKSAGEKMQGVGAIASIGITAPIVAAGTAAIAASVHLNELMANVQSLGVSAERVQELKGAVQDLAITTGKSTSDLAGGLYQVISAFGDSADTVTILEINAKAAAAGLATTEEAIALTSAVTKGYGDTSADAVQKVSDLAFTTVQLGQTTFPELAASMGRVTPLAASMGLSMEEMFAAMATGTGVTGSAAEVSTQLRGVLQSLLAPTGDMTDLLADLGYESGTAMLQQEGLQGTIQSVIKYAEASGAPLQKYVSSIEAQTLALALSGPQADSYVQKLGAMTGAAGATDAAFKAQTEGINALGFKWQQLQVRLSVVLQQLGDALAPVLAEVFDNLQPLIQQVEAWVKAFSAADSATQRVVFVVAALAAAAGPALILLGTAVSFAGTALAGLGTVMGIVLSPIGLLVGAAVLLGAAWATNFGGIRDITASVVEAVTPILNDLWTAVEWIWNGEGGNVDWWGDITAAVEGLVGLDPGSLDWLADGLFNAGEAASAFITGAQDIARQVVDVLAPGFERVSEALGTLGGSFTTLAPNFADLGATFGGLGESIGGVLTALQPLVMALGVVLVAAGSFGVNMLASAIESLPGIIGPIIDQVTATIILISTTLTEVTALITATINGDWAGAWAAAQNIVAGYGTFIGSTLDNMKSQFSTVFGVISEAVVNTLADLGVDMQAQMDAISGFWGGAWQGLQTGMQPILDGFATVNTAIEGAEQALQGFADWLGGLTVPNPFAGVADAVGGIGSGVSGFFGGGGAQNNQLGTSYAHGGWSWVGENRRPELLYLPRGSRVLPWGDAQAAGGPGGGGVTVNIASANVRNERDLYGLAYRINDIAERRTR